MTFVQNLEGSTLFFSLDGTLVAYNDLAAKHFLKVFDIRLSQNLPFEKVFNKSDVDKRRDLLDICVKERISQSFEQKFL